MSANHPWIVSRAMKGLSLLSRKPARFGAAGTGWQRQSTEASAALSPCCSGHCSVPNLRLRELSA